MIFLSFMEQTWAKDTFLYNVKDEQHSLSTFITLPQNGELDILEDLHCFCIDKCYSVHPHSILYQHVHILQETQPAFNL